MSKHKEPMSKHPKLVTTTTVQRRRCKSVIIVVICFALPDKMRCMSMIVKITFIEIHVTQK